GGQRDAKTEEPWYVLSKDYAHNLLIVGQGHDHPLLYSSNLICEQTTWITGHPPAETFNCTAKIRYRQADQPCNIEAGAKDQYHVTFARPQRAITPGQSIVFYDGDRCLGGGVILQSKVSPF